MGHPPPDERADGCWCGLAALLLPPSRGGDGTLCGRRQQRALEAPPATEEQDLPAERSASTPGKDSSEVRNDFEEAERASTAAATSPAPSDFAASSILPETPRGEVPAAFRSTPRRLCPEDREASAAVEEELPTNAVPPLAVHSLQGPESKGTERELGKELLDPRALLGKDTGVLFSERLLKPLFKQASERLCAGEVVEQEEERVSLQDSDVRPAGGAFSCAACRSCSREGRDPAAEQLPTAVQPVLIVGLAYDPPFSSRRAQGSDESPAASGSPMREL